MISFASLMILGPSSIYPTGDDTRVSRCDSGVVAMKFARLEVARVVIRTGSE